MKTLNSLKFTIIAILISTVGANASERIDFVHEYDLADYKGQTYLNFMRTEVKPAMDELAEDGYQIRGGDAIEKAYRLSDRKVQRKVRNKFGGIRLVKQIANALQFRTHNLNNLPGAIRGEARGIDVYGLSTFLGLASGGGVAVSFDDDNVAYNVHYDTTEERSGRSFGVGPTRRANDASDANYLRDIEEYVTGEDRGNYKEFYTGLFEALLNSDPSNYRNITPFGQTVLTDFLAVYTAEQARNLMDGRVRPHWDAALLEVTLLAAFHAGQDEIKLFYKNPRTGRTSFTTETLKQDACENPSREQTATMVDYWQFSRNINSENHCRRSGINITKREFRKLGRAITSHLYSENRSLFYRLKNAMGISRGRRVNNMYESLSYYLISDRLPTRLSEQKVVEFTKAWVEFLEFTKNEAKTITEELSR